MNRLTVALACVVIAGCSARKQVALRPPNHTDSGIPCKDYYPLPRGWVCDEQREIVTCGPGWKPYGLDRCVLASEAPKPSEEPK